MYAWRYLARKTYRHGFFVPTLRSCCKARVEGTCSQNFFGSDGGLKWRCSPSGSGGQEVVELSGGWSLSGGGGVKEKQRYEGRSHAVVEPRGILVIAY